MSATPTRRWTPPRLNLMTRSPSGTERSTCRKATLGLVLTTVAKAGSSAILVTTSRSTRSDTASALCGLLWACVQHMAQVPRLRRPAGRRATADTARHAPSHAYTTHADPLDPLDRTPLSLA